jgi:Type II secretion system (T2SS), protein K
MNSRRPSISLPLAFPASPRRGSVLVIVLITLVFTTLALVAFIEKASGDLLVEARAAEAARLRAEAYSALETTLAVLEDFRAVGGGLHSAAEGWGDPLAFAAWTPKEGRTVEIAFEDESGKLSLPRADALVLTNLFKTWEMPDADAEKLADALMGWMKRDHVYSSAISPDYEQAQLPYEPPGRSLRSFDELVAIDVVRDVFFKDGKPNELWHRFVNSVSLFSFRQSNINGAKPDVLGSHGQFDDTQQQQLTDFLAGAGAYKVQGPGWFTEMGTVRAIAGLAGNPTGFGTTISALRVDLIVREGQSVFHLSAVVAPAQNGATTVQTTASATRAATATNAAQGGSAPQRPSNTAQTSANPNAASNAKKLNYPFTLLEIRENDEILQAPTPPAAVPL